MLFYTQDDIIMPVSKKGNVIMTKAEIRALYKEKRLSIRTDEVFQKSKIIQDAFLASDIYKNASRIMLYMPIKNEVQTDKIIKSATLLKKSLLFPVTDRKTFEITPVLWDKESEFLEGAFCVNEPVGKKTSRIRQGDVIIVPGICFDKSGGRIGFGKGCYDRLLAGKSAIKVGFCYDFQIADKIPEDANDIKMNYLLCESGWIKCKEE